MRFRLLGPLEVDAVVEHPALRRNKPRALLALLLLHRNEVVSTDALLDGLWGESPPPRALGSLQNYVSQLRRVLGDHVLVTQPSGYQLRVGPDELDVDWFERLLTEASGKDASERAERLRSALALWRGPALADFTYEPFAQTAIARLEDLRLAALEERIEADLALGRHAQLIGELEALVAENSLRERLRGQLMRALYRAERQADALQAYQDARRTLVEELGIEPGPALRSLEQAILRQDAELSLPAAPPTTAPVVLETRRTVTVLFCDVADSTALGERIDPEALRRIFASYFEGARAAIDRHGGTVEKFIGDAVMAVFGLPALHEDDALRALRAAVEIRNGIGRLNDDIEHWGVTLETKIGINTGEVVTGEPAETLVTGDAVNVAARLQQVAEPGMVLLGDTTHRLVANAVVAEPIDLSLSGKSAPVRAWRLRDLVAGAEPFARQLDAPLVGRREELDQLTEALARVERERRPHLVTVLGHAGLGKTRLAREFAASLGDQVRTVVGRCLPYGEGITFWPLAEVVRQLAGDDLESGLARVLASDPEAELVAGRIVGAVGAASEPAAREETFWAVRRLIESAAHERTLLVVWEDLHWAEAMFLDLVEYLADAPREAPVLFLCLARPELLEERDGWGERKLSATTIDLEPLSPDESEVLADQLGAAVFEGSKRALLSATAEGNPLFLEQLVARSLESRDISGVPVPETIEALLAARLDRLGPGEQAAVHAAAVVGKEFSVAAVAELVPREARESVSRHMEELVRKKLLRPVRDGLSFRHILIRNAAYRAIPKRVRADLHERFGAWLELEVEQKPGDQRSSRAEILGYHLEQAFRYRQELGIVDAAAETTAERASDLLAFAAERAMAREDARAATSLLERAVDLLPIDAPKRLERQVQLATTMRPVGARERGLALLRSTLAAAQRTGDRRVEWLARIEQRIAADPEGHLRAPLAEEAAEAVKVFEELGEERGAALAGSVLAYTYCRDGRLAAGVEASMRALEQALDSGDLRTAWMAYGTLRGFLFASPYPIADGLRYLDRIYARLPGSSRERDAERAFYLALTGDFEQARQLVAAVRATSEEHGLALAQMDAAALASRIEWLAGDLVRAGEEAERALVIGTDIGEDPRERATVAIQLAEIRVELGQLERAQALIDEYDEHTHEGWFGIPMLAVHAVLLARRGDLPAALELAETAVTTALATDSPTLQGQAFVARAQVLAASSRPADAQRDLEQGVRLFERKGAVAWAAKVRQLGPALATGTFADRH